MDGYKDETIILATRHGVTEGNKARNMDGWGSTILTTEGRRQARRAGRMLWPYCQQHDIQLAGAAWVVSSLPRTRQTFESVEEGLAEAGAPPVNNGKVFFEHALMERSAGEHTDRNRDAVLAQHPEMQQVFTDPRFPYTPGADYPGESLMHVHIRVWKKLFGKFLFEHDVLGLVTHEMVMRVLLAQAMFGSLDRRALDSSQLETPNATFAHLTFNRFTFELKLVAADISNP